MKMHKETKYRFSKQRQLILDELIKTKGHPTADDLFQLVRKQLPRLSLGTVYRNLDALLQQDLISKIQIDGHPSRFEYKGNEHIHIRCIRCGKIEDLPFEPIFSMKDVKLKSEFKVIGYNQEFIGICPNCSKKKA